MKGLHEAFHPAPEAQEEYFLSLLDPRIGALARSLPPKKRVAYLQGLVTAVNSETWPSQTELTRHTNPLDQLPE